MKYYEVYFVLVFKKVQKPIKAQQKNTEINTIPRY